MFEKLMDDKEWEMKQNDPDVPLEKLQEEPTSTAR